MSQNKEPTKTELRDRRDKASFIMSIFSLGIGIIGVIPLLNKKSGDGDDEEVVYSEKLGKVRLRC